MKKQPLKLVDLIVLVAGVALSLASLRYHRASYGSMADFPSRLEYEANSSAMFLGPLTWTLAVLAMTRTPRRRWTSHPAVVVGVSVFAMTVVNLALMLIMNARYLATVGDVRLIVMSYVGSTAEYTATSTVAVFTLAAVGGRLRSPKGWLEWSGVILAVAWIATGLCFYLGVRT